MGLVDKIKDQVSGSGTQGEHAAGKAGQTSGGAGGVTGGASSSSGQEDYVDKALDFAEQKTGHTMDRNTNEKITDNARNLYEKGTGQKVNPKFSN